MTKLLEKAIAEIKKLPPERQEEIAATLLYIMEVESAPRLTPGQVEEVEASLLEANSGNFLSEEEVEGMYRKYGG